MAKLQPINVETKNGLMVGLIIVLVAVGGTVAKGKDLYDYISFNHFLNWRFLLIAMLGVGLIVWFIMNLLWNKEFKEHQQTRFDRDNYKVELKVSENKRLTDVITGIPNSASLQMEFEQFLSGNGSDKMQFIFIDLKNFRNANKKYGFIKTNEMLRTITQTIYNKMRRNEDMYKCPVDEKENNGDKNGFYRVHSGGDEFAFIIKGDQSEALGFCNRLVGQFRALTEISASIFGEVFPLSFYCSVVEVDTRDSVKDIFEKAGKCYRIAIEGKADFTICWHPVNTEGLLSRDEKKKYEYKRTRELFEVLSFENRKYDI